MGSALKIIKSPTKPPNNINIRNLNSTSNAIIIHGGSTHIYNHGPPQEEAGGLCIVGEYFYLLWRGRMPGPPPSRLAGGGRYTCRTSLPNRATPSRSLLLQALRLTRLANSGRIVSSTSSLASVPHRSAGICKRRLWFKCRAAPLTNLLLHQMLPSCLLHEFGIPPHTSPTSGVVRSCIHHGAAFASLT